jgi:hypothetical protein|uniref:2'-5' RNA ligase n=1 Tax=viral metagenome TaxID=1070528 RepID=A0A6C0BLT6_9ZZZZ
MSAYQLIKKPVDEIRQELAQYGAELHSTRLPETYLIKFTPQTKVGHPAINHLKGLIFNHTTGTIWSMTYPVPIEMKDLTPEESEFTLAQIFQNSLRHPYTVQEALDGTMLRLWYHPETQCWWLSTNGKEDSSEAYWMNGCSFYDQFWSAEPQIQTDHLNQNYVYLFLLCHPLNVIVVNHTQPKVYHVATYDRETLSELPPQEIGVEQLPDYFSPETGLAPTLEEIQKKIHEAHDKPVASAGFLVTQKTEIDGIVIVKRYRFENANYTRARELRGESNNIDFHLLELVLSDTPTSAEVLEEFLTFYPIYRSEVELLQQRLANLVGKLYREYGLRHKSHHDIFVHPRHHKFLGEIHTQIYLNRLKAQQKTVQYMDIMEMVRHQPPAKVLYLLNYIYDI